MILCCFALVAAAHTRTEFHFTVELPFEATAPLFGALAEQKWSPDFKAEVLWPDPPADAEGMVFRVNQPGHSSIWVNTALDLAGGHVAYVYVLNGVMMTRIDIRLSRACTARTAVQVVYERTALNPDANAHVEEFARHDRSAGPQWEAALNTYARTQTGR
jgi:hypothetical protein